MTTKKEQYIQHLNELYRRTRTRSAKLYEEACEFLPGGDTRTAAWFEPFPHFIQRGEGAYLYDADGNRLLDFQNNYTSLIHGHGHVPTVVAVARQMEQGSAYAAPFALQTKLASILVKRFPSLELVRFTNSGTEANMHVLRIARAFTGKAKIIKTEGGYHGTTDVFEASVDPNIKEAGSLDHIKVIPESRGVSENALKDVIVTPFNDLDRTEQVIREHHQEVACFIIEPVMGSAGQILPDPSYLKLLRELTRKYGILLVFDEVVTARLALGGAQELYGVTPDLTSLGKIIGGGTAIGAFGGREDIMRLYDPRQKKMYHSGTFNGNAVAMAAGIAALEAYGQEQVDYVNRLGTLLADGMRDCFRRTGLDIQVSGTGSLYNIIFSNDPVRSYRDVAGSHEELNRILYLALLLRGVFDAPRGMFCTSTAMTEADISFALTQLEDALTEMKEVAAETAPELILR